MQRLIITGPRRAEFEETSPPVCGDDEVLVRADTTARTRMGRRKRSKTTSNRKSNAKLTTP
ncbi:MAG: hypothetical protein QF805_29210, partial [Pirellulaceae bacterium]|nr:hypothetical protein [Pirellulaceae bacterium]